MTIEQFDANEDREDRFIATDWRCVRCRRRPSECGDVIQLAHRIPKGLVWRYGPRVVHHALSAVPSCSKCNQLLIVHGEELRALVDRIELMLETGETVSYRTMYSDLMEKLAENTR